MLGGFLSLISIQSSSQYLEEDKYHKYQDVWLFSHSSFQTLTAAPAGEYYVQDGLSWRSYLNHDFISSRRFLSDQKMQKAPVKWGSVRVCLSVQHLCAHRLLKPWFFVLYWNATTNCSQGLMILNQKQPSNPAVDRWTHLAWQDMENLTKCNPNLEKHSECWVPPSR